VEVQRVLNAHLAGGRAKLIEVLKPSGLVRTVDAEQADAEYHDEDQVDDANDLGSATLPSMLRLEARARRARLAAVAFAACAVLFAALAARPSIRPARASTARFSAPAPAIALTSPAPALVPPPPDSAREPAPPTAPEATAIATSVPSTTGEIQTSARPLAHRVFVDGRFVGESGGTITLPCGEHSVRVGGAGKAQTVTVPCGGAVVVAAR
jgi:hypothetical protein